MSNMIKCSCIDMISTLPLICTDILLMVIPCVITGILVCLRQLHIVAYLEHLIMDEQLVDMYVQYGNSLCIAEAWCFNYISAVC